MKVGIMSMQRVPNNGSFLQSYSLKKNIENMGHEVVFVDYKPGPVLIESEKVQQSKISEYIIKAKKHFCYPRKNNETWNHDCNEFVAWEKEYREKMMPLLKLSKTPEYQTSVDLLVIGSDEVFNCLQPNPEVGFSKQLFGGESNAKKVISYAASFGNTSLSGLKQYGIDNEVAGLLKDMDAISVRDKNSVGMVEKLTGATPEYHVDPVFLYDYEEEVPKTVPDSNYIVVYAYSRRISQKEAKAILKFAKKHQKKIVCLAGAQEYFGGFIKTNPFETLAYVKNADYVITDTFHGTVFSIKYNKKFASLVRTGEGKAYGNSNKMEDLLGRFHLKNHIIHDMNELESILSMDQSFEEVNNLIKEEREHSMAYLSEYLKRE